MATIEIKEAATPEDYEHARAFSRAFQRWLYVRYPDDHDMIDAYYPPETFEALMAELPQIHAPPRGVILLATLDGEAVGCGMARPLPEEDVCEMKRLWVEDRARGMGAARAICDGLFDWARAAGYRVMRLDTGPLHHEALALYRAVGFKERSPYYDIAPEQAARILFFERPL